MRRGRGRNPLKGLTRAGERESLVVDELLDGQRDFHVTAAIQPLARTALVGFELGEPGLPEAQNVGLYLADARNIANLEIETVGDGGLTSRRLEMSALCGERRGHGASRTKSGRREAPL